jgi:hypothetical protein
MSLAKKNLVKVAVALPIRSSLPIRPSLPDQPEPPLENVPPHKALARANARHAKLTEELRALKSDFAAENIRAQQTRTPIPTSRITHVETRRRELHLELESTQADIGRLNKLVRERKAAGKGNGSRQPAPPKAMPFRDDPEFPIYVMLACKEVLAPDLHAQVIRCAKALMADARQNGVND